MFFKNAVKSLADLDSNSIAELLTKQGFNGLRNSSCYCPVANYLSSKTSRSVMVGLTHIINIRNDNSYSTPDGVKEFILKFDAGHYPHLEA